MKQTLKKCFVSMSQLVHIHTFNPQKKTDCFFSNIFGFLKRTLKPVSLADCNNSKEIISKFFKISRIQFIATEIRDHMPVFFNLGYQLQTSTTKNKMNLRVGFEKVSSYEMTIQVGLTLNRNYYPSNEKYYYNR